MSPTVGEACLRQLNLPSRPTRYSLRQFLHSPPALRQSCGGNVLAVNDLHRGHPCPAHPEGKLNGQNRAVGRRSGRRHGGTGGDQRRLAENVRRRSRWWHRRTSGGQHSIRAGVGTRSDVDEVNNREYDQQRQGQQNESISEIFVHGEIPPAETLEGKGVNEIPG
jgi:hypothetical protein